MAYRRSFLKQQLGVIAFWHDLLPPQEMSMRCLHAHQTIIISTVGYVKPL